MTDQPICGFEQSELGVCRSPRDEAPGALRCTKHDRVFWKVCTGCAGLAHRECGHMDGVILCRKPLCMSCQHGADGSHGRPEATPQGTSPSVAAGNVRQQLVDALARSLDSAAERGLISFPAPDYSTRVAAIVLDDLSAVALLGLLGGMAAHGGA